MKKTITEQIIPLSEDQRKPEEIARAVRKHIESIFAYSSKSLVAIYNERKKVVSSFLGYLEKAFSEKEYGFYYDDNFQKEHSTVLVVSEFKKDKVSNEVYLQTTRKTDCTFAEMKKLANANARGNRIASPNFFYIHTPPRTKKEVICFDSIASVMGCIAVMGYSEEDGFSNNFQIINGSKWQMRCVNNQRYRIAVETNDEVDSGTTLDIDKQPHETEEQIGDETIANITDQQCEIEEQSSQKIILRKKEGFVSFVPECVFCTSNGKMRMQRIRGEGFSRVTFKSIHKILPVIDDAQTTLPYWIFLLYLRLRHNETKTKTALRGLENHKNERSMWDDNRVMNLFLSNVNFDEHDLRFLKFLLDEIELIQNELQTVFSTENYARSPYMEKLAENDLPLYNKTLDMFKTVSIDKTLDLLRYEYKEDVRRLELIKDTLYMTVQTPDGREVSYRK